MGVSRAPVLVPTDRGLYCPAGDFHIDPWKPVERAIITHAHSDHARWGMDRYLCSREGSGVLRRRVGWDSNIDSLEYGESLTIGSAKVSLHPAGHILGSAQVRVEVDGEVAVVSGDYKTDPDSTCTPFEPVKCHLFVTESTFGLPIYHWPSEESLRSEIDAWWRANQAAGRCSLLLGYALGKCQRALAMLDPSIGPIFLHGAVTGLTQDYRDMGVDLPATMKVSDAEKGHDWSQAIVLAPPSAHGTTWSRRFGDQSAAFLSGWMAIRGARRRRAVDRGFVMSDHVDWPSLIAAIGATEAERVWVTHGYVNVVVRYLLEQGLDAEVYNGHFELEDAEMGEEGE